MLARKPVIIIASILFIVIIVGGILLNFANASTAGINLSPPHQNHPYINFSDGASAISAHKDNTLLSLADVKNYVLTHPSPIGPTVSDGPVKIVAIQLMTSHNASKVMHEEYVGLPDDAPVYYVLLKGPFIPVDIITVTGMHISSVDFMEEVFDAYTGNQLLWGT
ncbi:MAG: hypothetical protein ACRDIV_09020 [Ktedonobacteraceae bacterium]